MNDADARYEVTKARPGDDPLGDVDRLIVDREQRAVVAIVYGAELAETACAAFEDRRLWGDTDRLELGPISDVERTADGPVDHRALVVDLTESGYVAFRSASDDRAVRVIRHEAYALHAALGAWLHDTGKT